MIPSLEGQMGVVHVQLPDYQRQAADRQINGGQTAGETEFLLESARLCADCLDAEHEISAMVERADADVGAGRFVTVATPEDSQARHEAARARLRARMASDVAWSNCGSSGPASLYRP
jgi:hypothetical protein